jgi:hypothetical protein
MKFFAHESKKDVPLVNMTLQLQIIGKGKAGYKHVNTDATGHFTLNTSYADTKISTSILNTGFTPWTVAKDGAVLEIDTEFHARMKHHK